MNGLIFLLFSAFLIQLVEPNPDSLKIFVGPRKVYEVEFPENARMKEPITKIQVMSHVCPGRQDMRTGRILVIRHVYNIIFILHRYNYSIEFVKIATENIETYVSKWFDKLLCYVVMKVLLKYYYCYNKSKKI